jgi:RHS repeat-associated protein
MPTTKYIWDEQNYLAEADASDAVNVVYTNEPEKYGYLVSTRISGTTSYHHFDALGSTRQLTTSAGSTTDSMTYDAWGNVINRTGTTGAALLWIGEIGYYFDPESSALWVRHRVYVPTIARWAASDSAGFRDGTNRYIYTQNRSVSAVDPTGLIAVVPLREHLLGRLPCVSTPFVRWDFELDAAAPCDGFILQRVSVACVIGACCGPFKIRQAFTYLEAWHVTAGETLSDVRVPPVGGGAPASSFTDQAAFSVPPNTAGGYEQNGEIRFYCERDTGVINWRPGGVYGAGQCRTSVGDLLSTAGKNDHSPWTTCTPKGVRFERGIRF